MTSSRNFLLISAVLLFALGWGVVLQQQQHLALQAELARRQSDASLLSRLRAENRRLAGRQGSPEEWQRLLGVHSDRDKTQRKVAALRETLARLKGQETESSKPKADKLALTGPRRTAAEWQIAGTGSPLATFESFVCAATRGEPDKLAPMLTFEPKDRAKLEALYASLPESERSRYGSPEMLAATLVSVQVPQNLNAFGLVADLTTNTGEVALNLRLEKESSASEDITFVFRQSNGSWQLIVPSYVVSHFGRALEVAAKAAPKS